jgi:hypothetical protein
LAIKSIKDLLGQDIDEESDMRWFHLDALSRLSTTWTEIKSYQSVIDLVRSWKDSTAQNRGPTYWFRRAAFEGDLHKSIIVAAKIAGAVEEIISL